MNCPNCGQLLTHTEKDNQQILHCKNCGCSFFEENGINRITVETAGELYHDRQNDEVSGSQKYCPKDGANLVQINEGESVPKNVILLKCAKCKGIFTYPEDLLLFKKAQQAKINYFSTWSLPVPSMKTIAVLSVTAFLTALLFTGYLTKNPGPKTQASGVVKRVYVNRSGIYLFISFTTNKPYASTVLFFDKTKNLTIRKVVATKATTYHELIVSGLNLNNELYYQIILREASGQEIKTELQKVRF